MCNMSLWVSLPPLGVGHGYAKSYEVITDVCTLLFLNALVRSNIKQPWVLFPLVPQSYGDFKASLMQLD